MLASHKNSLKHARRNAESQVFEIRVIKLGSAVRGFGKCVFLNWNTILLCFSNGDTFMICLSKLGYIFVLYGETQC